MARASVTTAEEVEGGPPPAFVRLLGDVHADLATGPAIPRTRKARAMLAYLAATPGGATRQRLVALLWSDRGPDQARASVRQAIYELRALLGSAALLTPGEQVTLDPGRVGSDLLAISSETPDRPEALLRLFDAAGDDLLGGVDDVGEAFDDWLRDTRNRLAADLARRARLAAETALDGTPDLAVRLADHALRLDCHDEGAVRAALRAEAALGEHGRVHRRYRSFAERLRNDLGAAPSPETEQVYHATRRADPAPPPAPAPVEFPPAEPRPRRRLAAWGLLLLALPGAVGLWWARPPRPADPLVAVLPFQNLSRTDDPYFASGVAEEVQNLLSRAPGIGVLGRTSATEFARGGDPLAAARALRVTHLLDGSVRAHGDHVLVMVRLVRTADGRQLWSDRYDRRLDDVFRVQSEIAEAVTARFARRLPRQSPSVTLQPAVYDRYLSARALMRDRGVVPLALADRALREAIARQPDYAPAHALLAEVLMLEAHHPVSYGLLPFDRTRAEATREARLAARLDPALGEAQAALGLLTYSDTRSLPFYARAVALDPQRSDFHRWLGQSLLAVGRTEEGLAALRRAVAIDPLWELNAEHLVGALGQLGRRRELGQVVRRFHHLSHDARGLAELDYVHADAEWRLADSYRHALRFVRLTPGERRGQFRLASALAALGERAAALRRLGTEDAVGRAVLLGRTDRLAALARRQGASFWDSAVEFWDVGDQLATHDPATLVRLFDQRFGGLARFPARYPPDGFGLAPLVIALRKVGRAGEADQLLGRLRGQLDRAAAVFGPGPDLLAQRAVAASLSGDRAATLRLLALAARHEPARLGGVPYRRLADRAAFRWLANDPALKADDGLLLASINGERRKLGWAPLKAAPLQMSLLTAR